MGLLSQPLGLGAWTNLCSTCLRASSCDLVWRRRMGRKHRVWIWRRLWLVPARMGSTLLSVVSLESRILPQRKRDEHAHREHHEYHEQLLQQSAEPLRPPEHAVREPSSAWCNHCCAEPNS